MAQWDPVLKCLSEQLPMTFKIVDVMNRLLELAARSHYPFTLQPTPSPADWQDIQSMFGAIIDTHMLFESYLIPGEQLAEQLRLASQHANDEISRQQTSLAEVAYRLVADHLMNLEIDVTDLIR